MNAGPPPGVNPPGLDRAMNVQDRHTPELLRKPGIVGTATSISKDGTPTILVYAMTKALAQKANLPAQLEKVPVNVEATGMFVARADETARRRPTPIGFSMGHPDITAGTFGARVRDASGKVYALSNNHVLADVNQASIGDNTLQPGPADGGTNPDDAIGTLSDYEPIDFSGSNIMDAAITRSSTANLGYSTTDEGYGTPSSTPYPLDGDDDGNTDGDIVSLGVEKYGRTTGLTQGEVTEINVTVSVCYETAGPFRCKQSATFVDQLSISPGSFSDGGDSGSLIVTDDSNNDPVGLLFAGSDTRTLANPIDAVLDRFQVTVDDGSSGGGDANTFTLSVSGRKVRGLHTNDLSWTGATSTEVDIQLDGTALTTTANDGAYTHETSNRGSGSYTYQVCEADTGTCSNEAAVTY